MSPNAGNLPMVWKRAHRSMVAVALTMGCFYLPPETTLTIITPTNGSTLAYSNSIKFEATATNASGLKSLELDAGGVNGATDVVLSVCRASGSSVTSLSCEANIIPSDNMELFLGGTLSLSATAVDKSGVVTSQTISVTVSLITCAFQQPAVTPGSNPPEADLSGQDPVTIDVAGAFPSEEVVVTSDTNVTVAFWTSMPYTMSVDWCAVLGEGTHGLTVTCDDTQGNTGSANLQVQVACNSPTCSSDEQCSAPTPRCDTNVGQCVQCVEFTDCPEDNECVQDVCEMECSSSAACPAGQFCSESTGTCAPEPPDAEF